MLQVLSRRGFDSVQASEEHADRDNVLWCCMCQVGKALIAHKLLPVPKQ